MSKNDLRLYELLKQYLHTDPDALLFAVSFLAYCHAIDDIIDGDKTDSEHIIKTFEFAATLYSSPFYQRNINILYALVRATSNAYADSVRMEKSKVKWEQTIADTLRQYGNEVIIACIEIVSGYDARREVSQQIRSISYKEHHTDKGTPI